MVQLIRVRQPPGAFQFVITGPPADYAILGSGDLAAWSELGTVTNRLGNVVFTDVMAHLSPRKFYRALQHSLPTNMVFIPPNTFTMGSPTSELHRDTNEGPQTTVTLSGGFWIGKYEVTQGEYLSVMNTNPSFFPGDLSRPVSSVSWFDATNYCWKLTQRELAAGRIPPGSRYRLPTGFACGGVVCDARRDVQRLVGPCGICDVPSLAPSLARTFRREVGPGVRSIFPTRSKAQ
jgi:hypothetical protein